MKLLVTGAHGFIGSNFVHKLLGDSDLGIRKLVVLDKNTYAGNEANLTSLHKDRRLSIVEGDIGDYSLVSNLLHDHQIDGVVNFAAESHVDRSIDSPAPFFEANTMGVLHLLNACRHYYKSLWGTKKQTFRFLQVSTDEVYGSLGENDPAFQESTPYAPNSPYAASKAGGDFVARSYFHTYGLPVLITNCSNNYGPFQFPEKLIPLMIIKALREEEMTIYGDGLNVRDWLHVEDHCDAIWEVLRKGIPGETYNIGGNCELSNIQVVDTICEALGSRIKPRSVNSYKDLKAFVQDRPGHDRRYAVDTSKIEQELGWRPRHNFAEGIQQTVDWYLNQAHWWQKILGNRYSGDRLGMAA